MHDQDVVDRAEVVEEPVDLLPGRSADDGPRFIAEDPETGCRGVGQFEHEACTNLVHAVEAYRNDPEAEAGYLSAGRHQTYEMRWLVDGGITDRLRDSLPF